MESHPLEHRVSVLAELARTLGKERFLARYPDPAVVLLGGGGAGLDHDTGFRTLEVVDDGAGGRSSLGVHRDAPVWWVRKVQSTFPDKITFGRSSNNDITLRDPSVSKLHGYISKQPNGFAIVDAESRHGTTVDDRPLVPLESRTLEDTAVIRPGPAVRLLFCLPESFLPVLELAVGAS